MTDAEIAELKRLAGIWREQAGLPGPDVNRLLDGAAKALDELVALRAAATACLSASATGVSEAEGMRRLDVLARLVGYDAGPVPKVGLPPPRSGDFDAMARELNRLLEVVAYEGERYSPGWAFALFAYEDKDDPQNGHVLAGSRDRDRTLAAVAKWVMERIDAQRAKARG